MKSPSVKDYGGDHCVTGRAGRVKLSTATTRSHRCLDCGHVRYVIPAELRRAARPRCLRCGGPLEETAAFQKREYGTKTERKAKELNTAAYRGAFKCWSCGAGFETAPAVAGHLRARSECVYDYRRDGKTCPVTLADKSRATVFVGTAEVQRSDGSYKPWFVQAVSTGPGHEVTVVSRWQLQRDALAECERLNAGRVA